MLESKDLYEEIEKKFNQLKSIENRLKEYQLNQEKLEKEVNDLKNENCKLRKDLELLMVEVSKQNQTWLERVLKKAEQD